MNHQAFLLIVISILTLSVVDGTGEDLSFRTLAQGGNSSITKTTNVVIKTKIDWEKYWKSHQGKADPPAACPSVDFEKEMVVAVAMGRKPTGGYWITIKRIERTATSLKVYLEQRTPGPGALVTQALTAPFHFVAVAKSELKAEFKTGD